MRTFNNTSIVIIEDDEIIREGYTELIGGSPGFTVVNNYASFDAAEKTILNDKPDVILLDIEMPGTNGIAAIPKLKKMLPRTDIIILTVYESEKQIFNALANGASGYLTKNTAPARIIESINEVMAGGGPMSINIARLVIESFQRNRNSPLSERETQVLELVAEGKDRSRIADELFINMETVRTHIKKIYYKLNVSSKSEAIRKAKENKLI